MLLLGLLLSGCSIAGSSSFGSASYSVDQIPSPPASAFATPTYTWGLSADPQIVWTVTVVSASDVPVGSPCDGSYDATEIASFDLTGGHVPAGNLAPSTIVPPEQALPVLAGTEWPPFDTENWANFTPGNDDVHDAAITGTVTITSADEAYIDADFAILVHHLVDDRTRTITGSFHAGECR
ncbi:MAG: hypothetical protein ABJE66_36950 [Deltaproteobacteria bacterium]